MVWYWSENIIRLQCFNVVTSWDNWCCLTKVTLFQNGVFKLFSYEAQNWKWKYRYRKSRFLFLPATCHVDYLLNTFNSGLIWLNNQLTVLDLVNLSSHLIASSGETLLFDKSIYPFSLSTLITTTHSFLPIRMSLFIERIRLLDNSLRRIMPSMLLYSSKLT